MEKRFETFTGLILNISRCITKIKNVEMNNLKLKGKQVQCLFALHNSGGAGITQLAQMCDEDKGAMSRTVKELQTAGLVFIEENADKKYRNPIKLTQKGGKISQIISQKIVDMFALGSLGLSDNDRVKFYDVLKRISANLTHICKSYGGKNCLKY